jgi:hypothetical protein
MPGSRHAKSAAPDIGWSAPTIHIEAEVAAALEAG